MTVSEIIKAVRWCIDEESNNTSDMADVIDEKDDSYMDNIIRAKITDALHWISITASSSGVLSGSTTTSKTSTSTTTVNMNVEQFDKDRNIGKISMPTSIFVFNVNRVRCNGWYKAVVPVEDTDDEALKMFDGSAFGTYDRPQAAVMREEPLSVLIQPSPEDGVATVSYVGIPKDITTDSDGNESVDIPEKFKSSFIYYIAFLLLSAYDDSKASQMYTIALQQLGATTNSN